MNKILTKKEIEDWVKETWQLAERRAWADSVAVDKIVELAIQGHAGTRDAIRWAMQQEREACAKILDENAKACENNSMLADVLKGNAMAIRARGKE